MIAIRHLTENRLLSSRRTGFCPLLPGTLIRGSRFSASHLTQLSTYIYTFVSSLQCGILVNMASPSNTTSTSPVLILGHSFVRRLKEFVRCCAQGNTYSLDFYLTQRCDVSILGIEGRTVDKIVRHDLHNIRRMAPEIVILELGSNDLCDESCDAESVSLAIEALVELLH